MAAIREAGADAGCLAVLSRQAAVLRAARGQARRRSACLHRSAGQGRRREGALVKLLALAVVLAALIASGIHPHDRITWWMEVAPVLVVVPILIATHKRFPLTGLLYALV